MKQIHYFFVSRNIFQNILHAKTQGLQSLYRFWLLCLQLQLPLRSIYAYRSGYVPVRTINQKPIPLGLDISNQNLRFDPIHFELIVLDL